MTDIDTRDTRVGTACTFTGKGSLDRKGRRRLALFVPALAVLSVCAAGAVYFVAESPFQHRVPAPTAVRTAAPTPRASTPAPDLRSYTAGAPSVLPPSSPSPPRKSQAAPAPGSVVHAVAAPAAAPSVATVHAPTEGPSVPHASSRNEASRPPSVPPSPRFHVQAGSFEDRDNAVALAVQLRAHGFAVVITNGPLYRVWVGGGYLDRGTAEQLASNLRSSGFDATLIPR